MADPSPTVYLIAGPNGAGKTTFAKQFLPHEVQCSEFLNADLIAAGLSPFSLEKDDVQAGRLMLQRLDELATKRVDFGFETTLAGRSYVQRLSVLRQEGYKVWLFFLHLPSIEVAIARVANRVRQGGHNILPETIARRYASGLRNFFHLYRPLVDAWWLYDGYCLPPATIARCKDGHLLVEQQGLYDEFERLADHIP